MRRFRTSLIILCLFLAAGVPLPPAQAAPVPEAAGGARDIAGAGRLRMQAQRLAKLYQLALLEMNADAAQRQIAAASQEVDGEFQRLARFARQPATQRQFSRSEAVWQELRAALKGSPNRAGGERVNLLADELMLHAGKLAMQIETDGETPVGRLLDLSSRLNMLSQRLARLYLLAHAGDRSQGVLTDMEQARREFATGLQELATARENTQASREAIALAKNQWLFFELAISDLNQARRGDGRAARNVATSSERIAQVLDEASAQYARDYSANQGGTR